MCKSNTYNYARIGASEAQGQGRERGLKLRCATARPKPARVLRELCDNNKKICVGAVYQTIKMTSSTQAHRRSRVTAVRWEAMAEAFFSSHSLSSLCSCVNISS